MSGCSNVPTATTPAGGSDGAVQRAANTPATQAAAEDHESHIEFSAARSYPVTAVMQAGTYFSNPR